MRLSHVVLASQVSGVELVSLLNIRTAGSIQRSIFAAPKVDESVVDMDDNHTKPEINEGTDTIGVFNDYLRSLTSDKYLKKAKKKLEMSLPTDIDENTFFKELESDKIATSGEDFNVSSKEVDDFAKGNDLNAEQTKFANAYVSLVRHEKGYLDAVFGRIISSAAKKLIGDSDVKLFYQKIGDAINDIVTTLQLGAKNGKTPALESFLSSASYISANLIVSSIKARARNIAKSLKRKITGVNTMSFKKFLEESKEKNEDSQDVVEFLEKTNSLKDAPKDSSKSSWKGFVDSKNPGAWEKDAFEEAWKAYSKESSRKTKKTESINEPKKVERVDGSRSDDKNDEGLKFDDKFGKGSKFDDKEDESLNPEESMTKSEVKKIYKDIKEGLEIDILNKIQSESQQDAFEFAIEDAENSKSKGGTPEQYKRNPDAWKKFGINNGEDFRKFVKPHFIKLYKALGNKIKKLYGEEFIKVLTSSKLSHQLLVRSISSDKIKLASKVSKISVDMREGNVRVYEASKPQFSHEFYWKIENGLIHIAEVAEIEGNHIDEAYQAAFNAVKQER